MPTIVDDLRAIAANPGSRTKAEVVEILLAAADRIESKRMELARAKSQGRYEIKPKGGEPTAA